MAVMKTPGVYIVEKNAFPNSVVEVATAVPAFVGYTEKAVNGNKSLINKAWRITSMAEFRSYFGGPPKPRFNIEEGDGNSTILFNGKKYVTSRVDRYGLYYNMLLFYANGGGPCYVVSVGDYMPCIVLATNQRYTLFSRISDNGETRLNSAGER